MGSSTENPSETKHFKSKETSKLKLRLAQLHRPGPKQEM